jgi:flavin prenyltransferase
MNHICALKAQCQHDSKTKYLSQRFYGMSKKIVLAIAGSSGALYAKLMMEQLVLISDQWSDIGVVFSENALVNWQLEIGDTAGFYQFPFTYYQSRDFNAPFASGSAKYETMIVCPCSMGVLARVATGISDDLMTRAADVILKERRRLIMVTRETPLSLIHLRNMVALTEAGGIILPASPSFYGNQTQINEAAMTVVHRALDLAGFDITSYRWGAKE